MTPFFSRLSYSFGNEDSLTERKALKIHKNDRVMCITASGDRPLHLLLDDCKEIVAVDANPIQNYLLALKIAALQQLDYEEYLAFLGVTAAKKDRKETLKSLIPHMHPEAAQHWLNKPKVITKGVIYQGDLEKGAGTLASIALFLRKNKIRKLFAFEDLEEQRKFISEKWDTFGWKKAIDIGLNPNVSRWFVKDPGLYTKSSIRANNYIYERINSSLMNCLARENAMISLLLRGYVSEEAYPCYLTKEGSECIKNRLDRIHFKTSEVIEFLESAPSEHFDCFSLSDVASYLPYEQFNRLLHAIYRTAKPGARFSIRQVLSEHSFSETFQPLFQRDLALEQELTKADRSFMYRFFVGTIVK